MDFFFLCTLYLLPYSLLSYYIISVSLPYFILAGPMRECLGKHSCMSSTYPIAILNGAYLIISTGEIVLALAKASPMKNETMI